MWSRVYCVILVLFKGLMSVSISNVSATVNVNMNMNRSVFREKCTEILHLINAKRMTITTVYQMVQNLHKLVQYSLLCSRKWLHKNLVKVRFRIKQVAYYSHRQFVADLQNKTFILIK